LPHGERSGWTGWNIRDDLAPSGRTMRAQARNFGPSEEHARSVNLLSGVHQITCTHFVLWPSSGFLHALLSSFSLCHRGEFVAAPLGC
jgi:hypothetical protein